MPCFSMDCADADLFKELISVKAIFNLHLIRLFLNVSQVRRTPQRFRRTVMDHWCKIFVRPHVLPDAQPTVSKHRRTKRQKKDCQAIWADFKYTFQFFQYIQAGDSLFTPRDLLTQLTTPTCAQTGTFLTEMWGLRTRPLTTRIRKIFWICGLDLWMTKICGCGQTYRDD